MKSEIFVARKLKISIAESQYHDNQLMINTVTFCCDPLEQISVTLQKELNVDNIVTREILGHKTLIVNMGTDKWKKGVMYSVLLCSKDKNNNSAKRRRPIAFADAPAVESTPNLEQLLHPVKKQLSLLKDNCCVLILRQAAQIQCAILSCNYEWKHQLDQLWSVYGEVSKFDQPRSLMEAERLKRRTNWNLINYNVNKIYTLSDDLFDYNGCYDPEIATHPDTIASIQLPTSQKYIL